MQLPANETPAAAGGSEEMSLGAASFNVGSTNEFIPKGKMVATQEQFPDFDALDDGPKNKKKGKGKKGKKGVVQSNQAASTAEDEDLDHSVKWKGKPSDFFTLKKADQP